MERKLVCGLSQRSKSLKRTKDKDVNYKTVVILVQKYYNNTQQNLMEVMFMSHHHTVKSVVILLVLSLFLSLAFFQRLRERSRKKL